jgi:hypothetical protein
MRVSTNESKARFATEYNISVGRTSARVAAEPRWGDPR